MKCDFLLNHKFFFLFENSDILILRIHLHNSCDKCKMISKSYVPSTRIYGDDVFVRCSPNHTLHSDSHHCFVSHFSTHLGRRQQRNKMEKYLVPKKSSKNVGTNSGTNDVLLENADDKNVTKERVFDDAYFERRYKIEEYMEGGEYEEFHSVVTNCRDEMKELKKNMKSTLDDTVGYGKRDEKFQARQSKYNIAERLRSAIDQLEVALDHMRYAAAGAENVWNDVVHDAMDLMDSRTNENDPQEAIFEVL